ncbi:hypothetical protein CLAFUW4_08179 [Fulvia fulva]|uniref:Uncharacterized protein n=1 Tax=Passalora fulva TaxID=5499 RepID=A0A9Q8LCK9_PASFU|nr:uncharacterized protein CLAFUR5_08292 [Fulvia fulva]KAK4629236.1 hypothetical protein CLAFUR4_08184 [Fulvia fulva]KAK4629793.1 hypothetical protein CLAFUR0_08179 [Fulvia fulva]UJO14943.1 hypothetical protein CLAFUR5_08292 [Fulvia fulva]WPV12675.1 hypothetical protein CLAFUW4_08179 [Fulvia fulva]WPV27425.1 hypothetical protein CLAFUW7_08179 [Fulvia fulva]
MSEPISKRRIFPFFDLPRELRDFIYGFSLCDKRLEPDHHSAIWVTDVAPQNTMRVSRQFNEELREQVQKKAHLYIAQDYTTDPAPIQANTVPQQNSLRFLTVSIELNNGMFGLQAQRAWVVQAIRH